jgi:hypothetical protein
MMPRPKYRGYTVGDLRKKLEGVPDETPVLQYGFDHSLHPARFGVEAVEETIEQDFNQYWQDSHMREGSIKITALTLGEP